jgi:hypothetical protein
MMRLALVGALVLVSVAGESPALAADGEATVTGAFHPFGDDGRIAEAYLFNAADPSSSIPVDANVYDNDDFVVGAPAGSYRLAFRDGATGTWLAWLSYTPKHGATVTSEADTECEMPLELNAGDRTDLGIIKLGGIETSPCGAPFRRAGVIAGHITNPPQNGHVLAVMYFALSDKHAIAISEQQVYRAGGFSFPVVTKPGRYFLEFETDGDTALENTWQGGFLVKYDSDGDILDSPEAIAAARRLGSHATNRAVTETLSPHYDQDHLDPRAIWAVGAAILAILAVCVILVVRRRGRRATPTPMN